MGYKMKKIVILISLIFIYVISMIFIINFFSDEIYLYFGNIRWHYQNGNWENLNNGIPYNDFKVYNIAENKYVGTYNVKYENENWYIKKDKYTNIDYPALMFKGKKLNIASYEMKYDLNDSDVKKLLTHLNLETGNYTGYYIDFDLDNDGNKERIYCITNSEIVGFVNNTYYSLIYIEDDNKYEEIVLKKEKEKFDTLYFINSIIDVNNDNKYELLVIQTDLNQGADEGVVSMYGLDTGKYIKLISN